MDETDKSHAVSDPMKQSETECIPPAKPKKAAGFTLKKREKAPKKAKMSQISKTENRLRPPRKPKPPKVPKPPKAGSRKKFRLSRLLSKKQRILFWVCVVLVLIVVVNLIINVLGRRVDKKEIATPVRVVSPEKGRLVKRFQVGGYIESKTMVTVLPLASGVLDKLYVSVGETVKKGDLIAKINSDAYELQLSQAESAYLLAKSTYERLQKLKQANAVSRQEFDGAKTQYDAYSSQYQLAKLQVSYTSVQAPVDGVVLMTHLNVGDLAAPERPLITIGDIKSLVVKAGIPEDYYDLFLSKQETIRVRLHRNRLSMGGEEGYEAYIDHIAPFISAESRNFQVVCALKEQTDFLRPGMSIYLDFVMDEKADIYYLPFDVLVGDNTVWQLDDETVRSLFRITEADLADPERRPVHQAFQTMTHDSDSLFLFDEARIPVHPVEVISNFQTDRYFEIDSKYAESLFLIEGQHFVIDNQKVKVLK